MVYMFMFQKAGVMKLILVSYWSWNYVSYNDTKNKFIQNVTCCRFCGSASLLYTASNLTSWSNDCNHGCWDPWLQLLCVVTLTFKLPQLWHQMFHKWKETNKSFFTCIQALEYVESLPDQFVIICLNLFIKSLMSKCA